MSSTPRVRIEARAAESGVAAFEKGLAANLAVQLNQAASESQGAVDLLVFQEGRNFTPDGRFAIEEGLKRVGAFKVDVGPLEWAMTHERPLKLATECRSFYLGFRLVR